MSRLLEHKYNWMAIPADQVEVGDWYANHSTVTEVVIGPRKDDNPFDNVKRGEALIRCGDSFAVKGRIGDRMIVVGRKP